MYLFSSFLVKIIQGAAVVILSSLVLSFCSGAIS